MATLKELGIAATSLNNARDMGAQDTAKAFYQLASIFGQSKAFNGVGQFEGQPQSVGTSIYRQEVKINPAEMNGVKRIDATRVIMGAAGSQTNTFSTQTVSMLNEAIGSN